MLYFFDDFFVVFVVCCLNGVRLVCKLVLKDTPFEYTCSRTHSSGVVFPVNFLRTVRMTRIEILEYVVVTIIYIYHYCLCPIDPFYLRGAPKGVFVCEEKLVLLKPDAEELLARDPNPPD